MFHNSNPDYGMPMPINGFHFGPLRPAPAKDTVWQADQGASWGFSFGPFTRVSQNKGFERGYRGSIRVLQGLYRVVIVSGGFGLRKTSLPRYRPYACACVHA